MLIAASVLIVGLVAVILVSERYGLRFGGVVVVPLLAMYVLFDYRALPLFAVSSAVAYAGLEAIDRRAVLYGRRLLIAALLLGSLVPVATFLVAEFVLGEAFPLGNVAYLGSILPGIAAYNLRRLERDEQVADVVGSLSLVVGLVLLAATFVVTRSAVSEPGTFGAMLATAEGLVLGDASLVVVEPTPVLPRAGTVGLFVLGLVVNEWVRYRYGLRLAGLIAIPLVAVFTLADVRLLALFVGVVGVGAAFIRMIHRSTLLYGRNLLAGTCLAGVVLAAMATPFLPASAGLRPLVVGVLGGITAYNTHVLAPQERVRSLLLNVGTFAAVFTVANTAAFLLGREWFHPLGGSSLVFGLAALLVTVSLLLKFEAERPKQPIEMVANGGTVVPDGGTRARRDVTPDGDGDGPLAGRRVARVAPNARVVYRETDP